MAEPLRRLATIESNGQRLDCSNMGLSTEDMAAVLRSLSEEQRQNVRVLWLFRNQMERVPEEVWTLFDAEDMDVLSLFDNRLTRLPEQIGLMCNLTWFYADQNRLERLPSSLTNLTRLENVDLRDNPRLPRALTQCFGANHEASQGLLRDIGEHFGRVERAFAKCGQACVALLAIRSRSALWKACVPKDVARMIARMVFESRGESEWLS